MLSRKGGRIPGWHLCSCDRLRSVLQGASPPGFFSPEDTAGWVQHVSTCFRQAPRNSRDVPRGCVGLYFTVSLLLLLRGAPSPSQEAREAACHLFLPTRLLRLPQASAKGCVSSREVAEGETFPVQFPYVAIQDARAIAAEGVLYYSTKNIPLCRSGCSPPPTFLRGGTIELSGICFGVGVPRSALSLLVSTRFA